MNRLYHWDIEETKPFRNNTFLLKYGQVCRSIRRVFFPHILEKGVKDRGGSLSYVNDSSGWTIPHRRRVREHIAAYIVIWWMRRDTGARGHLLSLRTRKPHGAHTSFSVGNNLIFMLQHGEYYCMVHILTGYCSVQKCFCSDLSSFYTQNIRFFSCLFAVYFMHIMARYHVKCRRVHAKKIK